MTVTPIILATGTVSGPGAAGIDKEDLVESEVINLEDTAPENASASYEWFIDQSPLDTPVTLINPLTPTPSLVVPADAFNEAGTIVVRVRVDGSDALQNTLRLGLLLPNTGSRIPAHEEEGEFNANTNTEGWHRSQAKNMREVNKRLPYLLTADPTTAGGVAAPVGSIGLRDNAGSGETWSKTGAANTDWTLGGGGSGGWIRIVGVSVPGGSISNETFQDSPGNTILQSVDVSSGTFDVDVEASYPLVDVGGFSGTLPLVGSIYKGTVSVVVGGDGPLVARVFSPDDAAGAAKDTIEIIVDTPPELLTLSFIGGYPGSQTELKAGDTYQLTGTTDKLANGIELQDFGAHEGVPVILAFASNTSFTVTMTIGDRGTSLQALAARARARSVTTAALGTARDTNELGGSANGVDLVNLNNLFPGIVLGAITYPGGQGALKAAETATVVNALTNFDTVLYDSPNGDLTPTLPAVSENPKTVTRLAGVYNDSVNNFRITANRAANDATTVDQLIVIIANVAAQLTVTEPAARLRSGGNDGTAAQDHQITITANQQLFAAPTLAADGGGPRGVFQGGGFIGGPSVWTRDLRVVDSDDKGTFAWGAILGTNLAGIATAAITGDGNYTLGGFVARTLTFAAFATTTAMGVEVVDFTKLQAGTFTSTAGAALKQPIATPPSVTNGFTIDSLGINPTDVIWLDSPAAGANSGGTAQITNVEEVV